MRQRKRAGARPPTRLSPGAAARQGPVPEDFSGEALPSRSSSRPARSRRHSGRSEIMPSSLEISQTRYAAPGLRRVGGRAPARLRWRTAAHARTARRHHLFVGADRRIVPSASAAAAARRLGQPLQPLAAPAPSPPPPPRGRRRRAHTRTRTRAPARRAVARRPQDAAARRRARSQRDEPYGDEQHELGRVEHVGRALRPEKVAATLRAARPSRPTW